MRALNSFNLPISLTSLLLVSIGILVIYSSSKELAIQQSIFTALGILGFFLISRFDLQSIQNIVKPLYFLILSLLLLVLILGIETRGSIRWIPLGIFNIQPSEFAKPILILFLAKFWSDHLPSWMNILKSFFWFAPLMFLVFKQPDLGSSLTLLAIWMGMLVAAHVSIKKALILVLIAVFIFPVGWLSLHDYQKERFLSFLSPGSDPLGRGYNLIQSMISVGSGQFMGRGLGRGTQSRLQFLPEFRTDFIFASIAEELGFIGSVLILILYLFLLIYSLQLTLNLKNRFYFLIVIGVVSMLIFQTSVNIGMNVGLLPITGITLPLISYGGSSLIATFLSLGMVISAAKAGKTVDTRSETG